MCVCVFVCHLNVFVTEVVLESGPQCASADAAGYGHTNSRTIIPIVFRKKLRAD